MFIILLFGWIFFVAAIFLNMEKNSEQFDLFINRR